MVARPGEAIMGNGHTKALTSSLIRPALGSDPRLRARLPDRAGNPQRAGGAHGSLVQYAIPRAGGEARHAKGERMEGGDYACPFFLEPIFFEGSFHSAPSEQMVNAFLGLAHMSTANWVGSTPQSSHTV